MVKEFGCDLWSMLWCERLGDFRNKEGMYNIDFNSQIQILEWNPVCDHSIS